MKRVGKEVEKGVKRVGKIQRSFSCMDVASFLKALYMVKAAFMMKW